MSSNLIKGVRTHVDSENVRTIDSDMNQRFRPLSAISEREYIAEGTTDQWEEASEQFGEEYHGPEPEEELDPEEFLRNERERFLQEAQEMINDAKREAEQILQDAQIKAEQMKSEALKDAKKIGYQDGLSQASEEIALEKEALKKSWMEFNEQYQKAKKNMEPDMVQILIGLVKNLTGVILDNGNGVIMHLVGRALGRISRNNEFILHVSREDYAIVDGKKAFLQKVVGKDKKIEIYEEEELSKNQCRIETDDQILDCSLDVQMENLFENLILLSRT